MWLDALLRDVRHAGRALLKMPALALVVVVSLGVGIGANTVVFSWIQTVLLQPLPGVSRSASLHFVEPRAESGAHPGVSWPEFIDLRERLRTFSDLLAFRMTALYVGEPGRVERAYGLMVSGNYFQALGLRPAIGRLLSQNDTAKAGGEPVVVISYDYWQNRFGRSPAAIGQTVRANGDDLVIVGVTPKGFQGTVLGLAFDFWMPATLAPTLFAGSKELDDRSTRGYAAMGRLQPGVSAAQSQAELDGVMRELARAYPATNATMAGDVLAFWQSLRGPQRFMATALGLLQAIMLLLLLAVCGNTMNLVLARASARQREMGMRLALGSGPWRVISLLFTENLLLALAGALLGALLAVWGTRALGAMPQLAGLPIRFQTGVDAGGLAFALLLGVGSAIVFGVAPALQLARLDPQLAVRSGGASTAPRTRVRNVLMGVEVALALVILVIAALFFKSFMETRSTDPGFRREGVLLATYDLTGRNVAGSASATDAFTRAFADRVLQNLRSAPAVEAVAIATSVPLDIHGMPVRFFTVEGRQRNEAGFDQALSNTVTPGYFATLGIPLRAGTDFVDLEDTAAPPQVIVNEEFVRRYLDGMEPLGRAITVRERRYLIVGVARNSVYEAFGESSQPIIYYSYRDRPSTAGEIHVRTRAGTETALARDVRRAVADVDSSLPVYNVRTLSEHIDANLVFRRIPAQMFAVLGPMLLALAAIGIYAVVSYNVTLRTTEIGVRIALGATASRVVVQFVGQSLLFVGLGALAGWLVAFVVALDFVPGGTVDLPVFIGVPTVLLAVAAVACWVPARRATRVDPVVALRQE